MRRAMALIGLFLLLWAPASRAQVVEARKTFLSPGTFEIGGSAAFRNTTVVTDGSTSTPVNSVMVLPFAGYFVAEGLEVVLDPLSLAYSSTTNSSTLELLTLGGVAYNFRANVRAFPFVEGLGGFAFARSEAGSAVENRSGVAWGGRAGLKFLVTPSGLLNLGVQYLQVTLNRSGDQNRNGYNEFSATLGFTVWL
jgi:hypothetical protein